MGVNVVPEGAFVEPTHHTHEEMDTLAQMQHIVAGLVARRLMYKDKDLIAPTERSAVADEEAGVTGGGRARKGS